MKREKSRGPCRLPGFFLITSVLVASVNALAQGGSTDRLPGLEKGAFSDFRVYSNAYSIDTLSRGDFTNLEFFYPRLFASASATAGVYVAERGCRLALERRYSGAVVTTSETLWAYNSFEKDRLILKENQLVDLRYKSFTLSGNGVSYGCEFVGPHTQLALTVRWTNLSRFDFRRYDGSLVDSPQGIDTRLTEQRIALAPQLEGLQESSNRGRLLSLDLHYAWSGPGGRWPGRLAVENLFSRVSIDRAAFLNRSLNGIIAESTIFQRGQVSPLTGAYGNQAYQASLPRVWQIQAGNTLGHNKTIFLSALGVDETYQRGIGFRVGCLRGCLESPDLKSYQIEVDERFKMLSFSVQTQRWVLGAGLRLTDGFSLSSVHSIELSYVY